jgi:hypothetical protein
LSALTHESGIITRLFSRFVISGVHNRGEEVSIVSVGIGRGIGVGSVVSVVISGGGGVVVVVGNVVGGVGVESGISIIFFNIA